MVSAGQTVAVSSLDETPTGYRTEEGSGTLMATMEPHMRIVRADMQGYMQDHA
jgi:hypothetical protein